MQKVSGYYQCAVETPLGRQEFLLTVKANGDSFHGSAGGERDGEAGSMKIEGRVEGGTLSWTMALPKPMPLSVTCRATVDGDTLEGKVKAGVFGSYPITGTRTTAPAA